MENATITQELEEFQKKKDDIFKNMGMLNNLSEKLAYNIYQEEKRIEELQSKELVENKKKQADNEIQLLEIENTKMEKYLEILNRKHELELQFIEKICEQKAKVEKLGDKYPHIDIRSVSACDSQYYNELKNISSQHTKHIKEHKEHGPYTSHSLYTPVYADKDNQNGLPPRSSVSALFNHNNENSGHLQPPPPPQQHISAPVTHSVTTANSNPTPPTSSNTNNGTTKAPVTENNNQPSNPPPQRRLSLQDQLTNAINSRQFQNAVRGPPEERDNESDGGFSN